MTLSSLQNVTQRISLSPFLSLVLGMVVPSFAGAAKAQAGSEEVFELMFKASGVPSRNTRILANVALPNYDSTF